MKLEFRGIVEGKENMSKFDYANFYGGYDELAVSKEKYTREQAIEIAKVELERFKKPYYIAVGNGYARHRAGVNDDHEPCVGWWLEYTEHKRSCPCWVFHVAIDKNETHSKGYEYIFISDMHEHKATTKSEILRRK